MLLQEYFPRDLKHHVVTFYQFSWPYFLRGNALFQGISSFAFYEKIIFFPPSFTFFWLLLCNTSGSYFGGAKTNGFLISDFPSEMEFHLANLCSYTKFFCNFSIIEASAADLEAVEANHNGLKAGDMCYYEIGKSTYFCT